MRVLLYPEQVHLKEQFEKEGLTQSVYDFYRAEV